MRSRFSALPWTLRLSAAALAAMTTVPLVGTPASAAGGSYGAWTLAGATGSLPQSRPLPPTIAETGPEQAPELALAGGAFILVGGALVWTGRRRPND